MIGRVIDEMARRGMWRGIDRLLEAQNWTDGSYYHDGARCFIGHIADYRADSGCKGHAHSYEELADSINRMCTETRFDDMVNRFGMDRVVRAIKQRCGKHTALRVEQPASLTDSAVQKQEAVVGA